MRTFVNIYKNTECDGRIIHGEWETFEKAYAERHAESETYVLGTYIETVEIVRHKTATTQPMKNKNEITAEEFIRKRFNVPGNICLRDYFGPMRWNIDTIVGMLNAFAEQRDVNPNATQQEIP